MKKKGKKRSRKGEPKQKRIQREPDEKEKEKEEPDEKEKEGERKGEEKEEFDPVMNFGNLIKLKNKNKTAWNPSNDYWNGIICGKKIYSSGKHEIKIKIDQFPNPKNQLNEISLGVIKTENRENLINYRNREGTYFFQTNWNCNDQKLKSRKSKKENGIYAEKIFPKKNLNKNDIFTISLDMDQKKISFKINEKKLGGWENLKSKITKFKEGFFYC
ncbi:spry domain containing socs box protein [Anaeramoeba flamelloides]|uniref:Spry domain containing socs box protein n=1 Tax=Anaeramoeba flamelloides TaxID=1746091 RepID=A0ABQ8YR11_9EUKA|nr:spry domain containing socs box protein [Anaeramoeba flamelloides]